MNRTIKRLIKTSVVCAALWGVNACYGYDVYIGGNIKLDQLLNRGTWSYVADHASGYYNHPDGLRKMTLEQRKQIAAQFKNKRVFIEQNGHYVTQAWANPFDPKHPNAFSLSAAGFEPYGVIAVGRPVDDWKTLLQAYDKLGYKQCYVMTGISSGIKYKNGWLDAKNDVYRTCMALPGTAGGSMDEPVNLFFGYHGKWRQSTIDEIKWLHAHGKKFIYLMSPNSAGDQFLDLSKKLVRSLESAGAIPDIYAVEYYRKGYDMTPETVKDKAGNQLPANTVTGIAYWLMKHQDGAPGFADLWLQDGAGNAYAQGTITPQANNARAMVHIPANTHSISYTVNVTSKDSVIDYIPVIQVKTKSPIVGWTVSFAANGHNVTSEVMDGNGYVFKGNDVLWPGKTEHITMTLTRTASAATVSPLDIVLQLRAHPDSKIVRDAITLTTGGEAL